MPLQQTEFLSTRVSNVREIVQAENDETTANWTGLSAGVAGIVQANGYIGDGPVGVADSDTFLVELAPGWTLYLNLDAGQYFGRFGGSAPDLGPNFFGGRFVIESATGFQQLYDLGVD